MIHFSGAIMEQTHPTLPLILKDGVIEDSNGRAVGYASYSDRYLYVFLYNDKLVVTEGDCFDSDLAQLVAGRINEKYDYAFRILCSGGVTAVVEWLLGDVVLLGATSGYLSNGDRIWINAEDITTWPGLIRKL
jgi:hypothetical protein